MAQKSVAYVYNTPAAKNTTLHGVADAVGVAVAVDCILHKTARKESNIWLYYKSISTK